MHTDLRPLPLPLRRRRESLFQEFLPRFLPPSSSTRDRVSLAPFPLPSPSLSWPQGPLLDFLPSPLPSQGAKDLFLDRPKGLCGLLQPVAATLLFSTLLRLGKERDGSESHLLQSTFVLLPFLLIIKGGGSGVDGRRRRKGIPGKFRPSPSLPPILRARNESPCLCFLHLNTPFHLLSFCRFLLNFKCFVRRLLKYFEARVAT